MFFFQFDPIDISKINFIGRPESIAFYIFQDTMSQLPCNRPFGQIRHHVHRREHQASVAYFGFEQSAQPMVGHKIINDPDQGFHGNGIGNDRFGFKYTDPTIANWCGHR